MSNYYCLVAGLPDIVFDGSRVTFTVERFKEEIYPSLSADDARYVDLFFLSHDNANILAMLRHGEDAVLNSLGCYSQKELEEIIFSAKNGDIPLKGVPSYIYRFFEYYAANEANENIIWEDVLSSYYYDYAIKCKNSFVAEWFTFNLNVNNILVALSARKYKMSVVDAVIGEGEIAEALRTSGARDFGLTGTVEYLETLQRLSENSMLQEREHQLDEMRWKWLDENSVFNYFSIEKLFGFLIKLSIIERWMTLDAEEGMKRYNEMIAALKSGMDNESVVL